MTSSVTDALAELRRQFADQLAGRIDSIRTQFEAVRLPAWDVAQVETLHRLVHGLTGSAGTFGMMSLSVSARELEQLVMASLRLGHVPDPADWEAVKASLERLTQLAQVRLESNAPSLSPPPVVPRLDHSPLVYLVEDDREQAGGIVQALQDEGFRVRHFDRPVAFRAAMMEPTTEKPSAILMDMVFPEGEDVGVRLVQELGLGKEAGIPVVVLTVREDMPARLKAFRAGASRYLVKPVEPGRLVDIMDALTGRQPPQLYRVLMVDDDPLLLEAQAAVLRAAGMEVRTLQEPLHLLEVMQEFIPDVVVLDVYMPEATGPELAAVLRERDDHLNLPILFLSAEQDMSQQLLALNLGGDDFLVKPVQPDHLVAAVTARARRTRQNNAVRRRLQTTLYEREREHLALDHHAIVSITDAEGRITYVNDKFCQISGYRRDELLGRTHRVVKSGMHPPEFFAQMWNAIRSGQVWQGEVCNRGKSGRLYWVETTITPFLDDEGRPYQYVSMRTDITSLKRGERALRELVETTSGETGAAFMPSVVKGLASATGTRLAFVAIQDPKDETQARTLAMWDGDRLLENFTYPLEHTPCEQVLLLGEAHFSHEVARQFPDDAWLREQGIDSYAGVALFGANGMPLGHMGVMDSRPLEHAEEVQTLLQIFAARVAAEMQRQQDEEALRESEQKLMATLEATKDGILAVKSDGGVVFVNQQFREMWRLPETDRGGQQEDQLMVDLVKDQLIDPQAFVSRINELYRSDEESMDLLEFKDGRVFERHSRPLTDEDGVYGRVWSFHDITERRRAELEARAHKERLRRGQMYANIGTWEWQITTGELFWTERIAPLFGYPDGDLATSYENFLNAVHPDDRQLVTEAVAACVEHDVPYDIEHRVVWPDGTVRWLQERGAVVRDAAGNPLQMLGVVQDIDVRKRAELALADSQQRLDDANRMLQLVIDNIPARVFWKNTHLRYLGCNKAFARDAGFSEPVDLIGQTDLDLPWATTNAASYQRDDREVMEKGVVKLDYEESQTTATGEKIWLSTSKLPLKDAHDQLVGVLGTYTDITARKQAEQALVAARDEADRANKAKSEFLSNMSHELRTPLNAILGFGQLMEYDDDLPEEHQDNVHEILKAGRHLLELINEVLDLAKVESGRIDLSIEAVDLGLVVQECESLVQPLAEKRGISLEIKSQELRGSLVRADRTRLKQVLLNLLSNAIKYNRDAGRVWLQVEPQAEGRVRIWVRDTGHGISATQMQQLFQPFNRLDAEKSSIEGTGIGLTITRRIVEMMGGAVGVESEVGVGSGFWIDLQGEYSASPSALMPEETLWDLMEDPEPRHDTRYTVLYIEDNPANLKLVSQMLSRRKHIQLQTAHLPGLGIELALAHPPDLILLDINMPDMDGYQVLEVFKAEPRLKHIPVVAVTANAMPRDIERGTAAGFSDYLTKPLSLDRFLSVVDTYLVKGNKP